MPDDLQPRVALIGTGIMGGHMARRLVASGLSVTVWNRTASKAEATGAALASSPGEALAVADVAVVMLSNATVIEDVLFGSEAGARKMRPGSILTVMSSIPVSACRAHHEQLQTAGVDYVDAPVSGGEAGARDGTLAILAGGTAQAIAGIERVMKPLGRLTHLGPVGSGQLAKLANQIIVGGTIVAVAEALHFAQAGGADAAALQQALLGGFGESTILRQHGARMVREDFTPGSPATYQLKDLRAAGALAQEIGVKTTLLPAVTAMFEAMEDRGEGRLDVSAIFREVVRRSRFEASDPR